MTADTPREPVTEIDRVTDLVGVRPYRLMLDGTACWCASQEAPHVGWVHAPVCVERRVWAGYWAEVSDDR